MATITPQEAAELAAKMSVGNYAAAKPVVAPLIQGADAFAQKIRAQAPPLVEEAKARGDRYARNVIGLGDIVTDPDAKGRPADLSGRAQSQMKVEDLGATRMLDAPAAPVTAVPTLAEQAKHQAGTGGPGGGSTLLAAYRNAQQAGIRTLEEERELTGELGAAKAGRVMAVADLNTAEAQRQEREAMREKEAQDWANARFDKHQQAMDRRIDEIASAKTDPGRLLRNADARTQFNISLGASLGGALAAVNGGSNTSLDRLERIIAQDIRSQENEIDNKKSAAGLQNNMLAQLTADSGSRSIARQQLRVLNLEAAKQKIAADSERLGIPEVRVNAELQTNQIQQKIDQAKTALAKEAYATFMAQAAAAAAAARAAEEKAYQRQKDLFEMGLKKDQLEIDRIKAGKEAHKEDNAAITEATKRLNDDKIVSQAALIDRLASAVRDDGSVVGFDTASRAKVGAAKGLSFGLMPDLAASKVALSGPERIARKDWETAALLFGKDITGTGGSDEQMQRIQAAFEGAKSTEERRQAIIDLKKALDERRGNATAVLSDEQKAELMRRIKRDGGKK